CLVTGHAAARTREEERDTAAGWRRPAVVYPALRRLVSAPPIEKAIPSQEASEACVRAIAKDAPKPRSSRGAVALHLPAVVERMLQYGRRLCRAPRSTRRPTTTDCWGCPQPLRSTRSRPPTAGWPRPTTRI